MFKRSFGAFLIAGILAGMAFAQTPLMPPPDMLPAQAEPQVVRAEVAAVQAIICNDIHLVAQVLQQTGTLGQAVPIVVEMTGMQPADIEATEAAVCRTDLSEVSFEELRYKNRQAVWLLDVHLAALSKVTAPQ